jgi:hypothetical protein
LRPREAAAAVPTWGGRNAVVRDHQQLAGQVEGGVATAGGNRLVSPRRSRPGLSPLKAETRVRIPLAIRTRVLLRRARRPPATSNPSRGLRARPRAHPSACLLRRGRRVTKMVTKGCESPVSRELTTLHRVRANLSILLTGHHGTARHNQLSKLDVAASLPVARSDGAHQRVAWVSNQDPALPTRPRQAPNTSWGEKATVSRGSGHSPDRQPLGQDTVRIARSGQGSAARRLDTSGVTS